MLHLPGYWWYIWCITTFYITPPPPGYCRCIWCTTSFYATSPRVLVVYMMYYIVLCYIPRGTGGVYGVLHRSMLHIPGYWWCTTSFYVTSPRVLVVYTLYVTSTRIQVVYMVYYIVLCYIPHCTSGVYGVLHHSVLHPPVYW